MRTPLGWFCYQLVMAWPWQWPSGAVAGWILAWAGDYANETPNAKLTGDPQLYRGASSEQSERL